MWGIFNASVGSMTPAASVPPSWSVDVFESYFTSYGPNSLNWNLMIYNDMYNLKKPKLRNSNPIYSCQAA